MEWIAWLGNLFKLLGDLFPQREKIPPTHRGIKFRNMTESVVLQPGVYWYWPWRTEMHQIVIAQQTFWLDEQEVTTKDNRGVIIRGSVTYRVIDKDSAIIKATVETWDVENQVDDEAMAVYCDYVSSQTFKQIQADRAAVNKELTKQVRSRLNEYGVRVIRAQLTSFATGIPLLHMGNSSA
jgi:regulator of protease activity HflC (stomatin/prohibitin superfamily)